MATMTPFLLVLALLAVGVVLVSARSGAALSSFRALLAVSILPVLAQTRWVWGFASTWADAETGRSGVFPGLIWFAVITLLLSAALWLAAAWLAAKRPVLSAGLPLVLFFLYREVAIRALVAPSLGPAPPVDDVAVEHLFTMCAGSAVILAVAGWAWPARAAAGRRNGRAGR